MQSDQKIGLCLLIGLTGFGLALGFGRRDSMAEAVVREAELRPASQILQIDTPATDPEPAANGILRPLPESPRDRTSESDRPQYDDGLSPGPSLPPPVELRVRSVSEEAEDLVASVSSEPGTHVEFAAEASPTFPPTESGRSYIVRPGDTLSAIAHRELGDCDRYDEIFEANREALGHPDAIRVGQTLFLPVR